MTERGRLTEWNDDRGFGFVTPLGGGQRRFAHISEFPRELRRPQLNDLVTYEAAVDDRGRPQARRVTFLAPAHAKRSPARTAPPAGGFVVAGVFFLMLVALAVLERLPVVLLGLYALMSVLLFATYAQDKAAAQSGRWRTPEATLHLMALLGGWPGALVAQGVLRHKTRKQPFRTIFYATVVSNCALLVLTVSSLSAVPG
jgi:uncharacterized membrane protein YsdA (DUF1294 family)/cold shock CspA family protein